MFSVSMDNRSILTAYNTEIILMKESKHHSAFEKMVSFESENPVLDLDSNR